MLLLLYWRYLWSFRHFDRNDQKWSGVLSQGKQSTGLSKIGQKYSKEVPSEHRNSYQSIWVSLFSPFLLLVDLVEEMKYRNHWKMNINFSYKFWFCLTRRIFNLVADINSGVIFALLPPNVCMLAMSMYSFEHVNYFYWIISLCHDRGENWKSFFSLFRTFSNTEDWTWICQN